MYYTKTSTALFCAFDGSHSYDPIINVFLSRDWFRLVGSQWKMIFVLFAPDRQAGLVTFELFRNWQISDPIYYTS